MNTKQCRIIGGAPGNKRKRRAVFFQWIKTMSEARGSLNGDVQTTTNQVYEPADFIHLGSELDQEID